MSSNIFTLIHSWYPITCCSGKDCYPVPCDQLIEQTDGSVLYHGINFMASMVHPSQDALCHVCLNTYGAICVFLQYSF